MAVATQVEPVNLGWLMARVMRHRKAAVRSIGYGMLAGVTTAGEPYLIGQLINRIQEGAGMDVILGFVGAIVALAAVSIFAFNQLRFYSGEVAYSVDYDLRRSLFDNLLTLDQDFYKRYPSGDLISRMHNDMMVIWRLNALGFLRTGTAIFMLLTTFVLLALVNLPLTLMVFIILCGSTALQVWAGMALAPISEKVQDQAGVLAGIVQDSVSGVQTIKTTGKESSFSEQYRHENELYRDKWLHFRRRNEPVGMIPNGISEFTAAVVVMLGGLSAINGQMSVGDFTSFLLYLGTVSVWLLNLGTVYQRWQQAKAALNRLAPLTQPTKVASKPEAAPLETVRGEVVFERVSLTLDGAAVLRGVDLRIKAGEVVAIVGPTGSGKTQLVNLLARVNDPTTGRVLIDGVDVRDMLLDDVRAQVAYVPQSTFLFSRQLRDNVLMGREADDNTLNEAIRISRLSNDLPQLPKQLETMVGERGVMLSGGQKQRVAIARAIIRSPAVLVLDDALSSVDTHTAADILGDLRRVLKTRTSIIIAHRVATVKDADRIIVMDEGRVVEDGTHDSLVASGGFYAKLVEREMDVEAE
ncbi:MAG: ABC transporter ATP-binding protein/permease [Anaerolineae bacterium]|jgi:ATP-binding cassette subfamily B protein|nr:ABC transporter ATP-binding protein/permease [Anaerolineae bacterium]